MAHDLVYEGVRVGKLVLVSQRRVPATADDPVNLLLDPILKGGEVDAVHEQVGEVGAGGLGAGQEEVEHRVEVVPVACNEFWQTCK